MRQYFAMICLKCHGIPSFKIFTNTHHRRISKFFITNYHTLNHLYKLFIMHDVYINCDEENEVDAIQHVLQQSKIKLLSKL